MSSVTWTKVRYNDERDEFNRTIAAFSKGGGPKVVKDNGEALERLYNKSTLVLLSDTMWRKLENTDSFTTETVSDIAKAIERKARRITGKRSIEAVIKEFMTGKVRAPIVVEYDNGRKYALVAGNTRLMVARMLGIKPSVILIRTDW